MSHKKKIALAAVAIILAGGSFIIFLKDDSAGGQDTIASQDVIKIKLVQADRNKIRKAVDILSGKVVPMNEAVADGGGYFYFQQTKIVSQKRRPLDFLRGSKPNFAAMLAVNNMDIMKVPAKNGKPIRNFWKDTDTSQWPTGQWRKTSTYMWETGPDDQDCLFQLYDGTKGVIRFYDVKNNSLKIQYKIISKPDKPKTWGKPAVAMLPNGVVIEVLGSRKLGDESNKWITPDGGPLARAPYIREREPFGTIKEGRVGYEFATKRYYPSLGNGSSSTGSISPKGGTNFGSSSFSVKDEFGNSMYQVEGNAYLFEGQVKTAIFRRGIALGPRKTALATMDEEVEAEVDGKYIKISPPQRTDKGFTIDVIRSSNWKNYATRLIALKYDNKEKYLHWNDVTDLDRKNERRLYKYNHERETHDPWDLDDVKEFHFQHREYDYITIDNISLVEGVNAGVRISTELSAETRKHSPAEPVNLKGCSNLFKVSDALYRCAQPEKEGFTELEKLGIKTVVNLRAIHSDRSKLEQTKLAYIHIKMQAWDPEYDEIKQFLQIATNPKNWPVLVHCRHGADRTGTMVACYRMVVQGWSKEKALEEMRLGPFGFHEIWKGLPKFINKLDVEKMRKDLGITVENKND